MDEFMGRPTVRREDWEVFSHTAIQNEEERLYFALEPMFCFLFQILWDLDGAFSHVVYPDAVERK